MAIKPLKQVDRNDVKNAVLANAVGTGAYVISVGDAIQPGATGHNKYVTGEASSGLILGIVTGIRQSGKICEKDSITGVAAALTGTPSTGPGTDNETYKVWSVDYIPASLPIEYEADLDAVSGTTTNSDGIGFFALLGIDTTKGHAGTLDESKITLFGGTAQQFASYGVSTGSATKVVGRIYQPL
jgi:hypothetical protein